MLLIFNSRGQVSQQELLRMIKKCDSSNTGLINIMDFQVRVTCVVSPRQGSVVTPACSPVLQLLLNSVDVEKSAKFGPMTKKK